MTPGLLIPEPQSVAHKARLMFRSLRKAVRWIRTGKQWGIELQCPSFFIGYLVGSCAEVCQQELPDPSHGRAHLMPSFQGARTVKSQLAEAVVANLGVEEMETEFSLPPGSEGSLTLQLSVLVIRSPQALAHAVSSTPFFLL